MGREDWEGEGEGKMRIEMEMENGQWYGAGARGDGRVTVELGRELLSKNRVSQSPGEGKRDTGALIEA